MEEELMCLVEDDLIHWELFAKTSLRSVGAVIEQFAVKIH